MPPIRERADNPVHRLVRALAALTAAPLDAGTERFEPSTLQITSVDVGNPATNVIPASARAALNIRFNDRHTGAALAAWLRATMAQHAEQLRAGRAGQRRGFLTTARADGRAMLRPRSRASTGVAPRLDTGGGTSDARFIAPVLPGGGVRPGGRHHAPQRRERAGGGAAGAGRHLPRDPAGARVTQAGRSVLRGVALVARFRAEGLAASTASAQQLLSSLAPLLAFPAVFLIVLLAAGGSTSDAAELLSAIDAMLLQMVMSEALARRWGREAEWLRYAIAFNWCNGWCRWPGWRC